MNDDHNANSTEEQGTEGLPPRGSFPKGPRGETVEQRRERYELWVLGTRAPRPDMEAHSIKFYRGKTTMVRTGMEADAPKKEVPARASRRLCAASRCWQCEHGGDDANGADRIAACGVKECGLWPVRPYKPENEQGSGGQGDYKAAVRDYCSQCVGRCGPGGSWSEVQNCAVVTCAIWPVRPGG